MADYLEIEQKYEADAGFALPSLDALPGVTAVSAPETFHLDATYYDTADLTLIRNKVTLRRRTGGPDEGWHLKLPAGQDARQEVREPLGTAEVPARLRSRVADLVAGGPLSPVATILTERAVRRLYDNAGTPVAEVADDHVTAQRLAPPAGEPASWREIEVELLPGAPDGLLAGAGALLRDAGARAARSASKLARALGE
ncbi:MAG TPA: CYTH domain-containing protein [Streptosporangiaceae bacterium]|nr:CYTH domain-containing protein [Streptosporangiaceae bacterium]